MFSEETGSGFIYYGLFMLTYLNIVEKRLSDVKVRRLRGPVIHLQVDVGILCTR